MSADGGEESTTPIKVVYIASVGRSGSTLLESILGAHPQLETVGELHLLPHELRDRVRPCACGTTVDLCPFWTRVERASGVLDHPGPGLDHFREHHDGGRTLRWRRLVDLVGRTPRGGAAVDQQRYAEHSAAVFRACLDAFDEVEGRRPTGLVDASKDVYRLAWLARSPQLDLRVVLVVKDAPAYVFTTTKRLMADPASTRAQHWGRTARRATSWTAQNLLLLVATARASGTPVLRVRYEDLARRPDETMDTVFGFVGVVNSPGAVTGFRDGSVHTVAGNPMRYEDRPIALDERWKGRQPAWARRLTVLISWPVRRLYGYPAWRV